MYHSFLIHSSADGHLGCFHVLAMINSAAMNIGVRMSLSDLVSSVCMPSSGISGSYGSSISSFFKESPHCYFSNFAILFTCICWLSNLGRVFLFSLLFVHYLYYHWLTKIILIILNGLLSLLSLFSLRLKFCQIWPLKTSSCVLLYWLPYNLSTTLFSGTHTKDV